MTDIIADPTGPPDRSRGRLRALHAPGPVPPQALDAERSALAAMLLDRDMVGIAIGMLQPEVFYHVAHQKIFAAIVALYERNEPADLITVGEELRKRGDFEAVGGSEGVSRLLELATTRANAEQHMKIIRNKGLLRSLIKAAVDTEGEAYAADQETEEILDRAEQRIFAITDQRLREGVHRLRDLLKPAFEHIEMLYKRSTRITGVASGYEDLDELTAGFQKGDLVVIAGRPAMGKTSLAMNIAEHAAIRGNVPVAIFSLEMSKDQVVQRLLCSQGGVDLRRVRSGSLSNEDWPRLTAAAGLLIRAPMAIDDSAALSILEIRAKCRRLRAEDGLGLVIIDYLQLIRPSHEAENRVQEISQITRGLKALAKELELPVVALSQLSRAAETRDKSGRPQLSDLRESGSIEQDADVVMFVYREEVYKPETAEKGKALIILAKQRNGPTGEIPLTFLRPSTKFVPYTPVMIGETEEAF